MLLLVLLLLLVVVAVVVVSRGEDQGSGCRCLTRAGAVDAAASGKWLTVSAVGARTAAVQVALLSFQHWFTSPADDANGTPSGSTSL